MKTKLINFAQTSWRLLTEVPGWPDAPRAMRVRRVLPIIIPLAAMLLLAVWNATIRDPQIRAARAAHQPLVELEQEIEALRLTGSEQLATDLAAKSAEVAKLILDEPAELKPLLQTLKKEAIALYWEANLQAGDASAETTADDAQVIFLPVRGKLTSGKGNAEPFPTLLALLERFSSLEKRIDLTRLVIRADEQGRYAVEINLRLACRRTHEKTAQ